MVDYSNLLASRKMTLLPLVRVRISPSLVISSLPTIWSVVTKLLISPPVAVGVPDTDSLVVAKAHQLLVAGGVHHLFDAAHATPNLMIGSLGCSRSNILMTNHNIYLFAQKSPHQTTWESYRYYCASGESSALNNGNMLC